MSTTGRNRPDISYSQQRRQKDFDLNLDDLGKNVRSSIGKVDGLDPLAENIRICLLIIMCWTIQLKFVDPRERNTYSLLYKGWYDKGGFGTTSISILWKFLFWQIAAPLGIHSTQHHFTVGIPRCGNLPKPGNLPLKWIYWLFRTRLIISSFVYRLYVFFPPDQQLHWMFKHI